MFGQGFDSPRLHPEVDTPQEFVFLWRVCLAYQFRVGHGDRGTKSAKALISLNYFIIFDHANTVTFLCLFVVSEKDLFLYIGYTGIPNKKWTKNISHLSYI
ncbi:MAG TPA: hypothetical protein PKC41_04375, partial [Chitinophagaceae bacterium]|nr:hypothetical protein [Chitinophagaceae bacterium]